MGCLSFLLKIVKYLGNQSFGLQVEPEVAENLLSVADVPQIQPLRHKLTLEVHCVHIFPYIFKSYTI